MRFLWCVLASCLVAGAVSACGAKDTCLDYGGHYNETTKQCEK